MATVITTTSRQTTLVGPQKVHAKRWAGDIFATTTLSFVLLWLPFHDGGYPSHALRWTAVACLVAVPVAVSEARRIPRLAQLLIGTWQVGTMLALLFAAHRTGFVAEVLRVGIVPILGLLAHRIWRRPWGPAVLIVVLLAAFGLYWQRAYIAWWGMALSGRRPQWMALSWWNQSGTLMVSFGLLFGGLAVAGRRSIAAAGTLAAAGGLGAAWLSGSRGTVLVGVGGLAVLAAAGIRAVGWRSTVVRVAGVLAASSIVVFALLGLSVTSGGQGGSVVTQREESAAGNTVARLGHARAALAMFADRPLVGQGPGSYRYHGRGWSRPDVNLTADPHNRYAQALGETGVAGGVPFLALAVAAGWLAVRRVRRSPAPVAMDERMALRLPLSIGAAASVTSLLVHQGADFDWLYPILPALLAVGVGLLLADAPGRHVARLSRPSAGIATVLPAGILLVMGITAQVVATRTPGGTTTAAASLDVEFPAAWDGSGAEKLALDLIADDHHEAALEVLQRAHRWNRGNERLAAIVMLANYGRDAVAAETLTASLGRIPSDFLVHNHAVEALMESGDTHLARSVLDAVIERYPEHLAWGIGRSATRSYELSVRLALLEGGCSAAAAAAEAAAADPVLDHEHGALLARSMTDMPCRYVFVK